MAELVLHETKVTLRDWREADLDRYAYWLQPGHRWQELDAPYYPKPTAEEIPGIIARKKIEIQAGNLSMPRKELAIAERVSDDLLGRINCYWESEETLWLSLGITIFDSAYWGKGFGYQALGLWSDYLFRELPQIARLDLRTWSGNAGMMHLAEKLGYREEARFRKARIVGGKYYDSLGYGVLREEWQQRYPTGFTSRQPPSQLTG